ncbi:MAG: DEAD/DEAH box helicase family protein [Candidatus Hodarchaeales archaeon]|jgi:hypothetical protein
MIQFRDYQQNIIDKGTQVLLSKKFLYLSMEVRTGKTLTSLGIINKVMSVNNVLFITKKKAISSIQKDYELLNPSYSIQVINYESLHKVEPKGWDAIVCDEAHGMGAFPKPSKRAKQVRDLIRKNNCYVILLSGTPTPESYSQMYHQVYGIPNNPFNKYSNFYKFARDYVRITTKRIGGFMVNDYSNAKDTIIDEMKPYTISYTQKEAGFESSIKEKVLFVDAPDIIHSLCSKLKKDLVVEGSDEVILADTSVKLMQKLHQMYSGTVKFESGNSMVIDTFKAQYIYDNFCCNKIGIFYKFKEELNALKEVFGNQICTDLEEFNSTDKSIALQIVSGREGISLRNAKYLVYYNIDFSATSYWQSRDRMTTKERLDNEVFWIFTEGGIESKIYKSVSKKKDYTLNHFKRDLLTLN